MILGAFLGNISPEKLWEEKLPGKYLKQNWGKVFRAKDSLKLFWEEILELFLCRIISKGKLFFNLDFPGRVFGSISGKSF